MKAIRFYSWEVGCDRGSPSSSKIIQKTTKNRERIASKLEREKISSKIAGKSDLERFGAPFGKGLGGSGASLGRLLAVFLRFGIELS